MIVLFYWLMLMRLSAATSSTLTAAHFRQQYVNSEQDRPSGMEIIYTKPLDRVVSIFI